MIRCKFTNFLFLLCLIAASAEAREMIDKIVAVVDDKVITQSDIDEAVSRYAKFNRQNADQARRSVLDNLISEKLVAAELDKAGFKISDDEVEKAVRDFLVQRNTTLAAFKTELDKKGVSVAEFRNYIRQELMKSQFLQKIIYPRVRVSDFDLHEYYRQHQKDFMGYQKIRFLQIQLMPESVPTGQNPGLFARGMVTQLRKGGNFRELAKKYSRGAFADQGGDSGEMDGDALRSEMANILFQLPLNVVSEPMPGQGSIFIFKVLERKNPQPRSFESVQEIIRQIFADKKVADESEAYLMEARTRHYVEIKK